MKITVLMHEKDPPLSFYWLSHFCDIWREQGHEIEVLHGLAQPVSGDLVFLHVDLTFTPPEYLRAVADHPRVVNRRLVDISKAHTSRFLVHSPDEWDGPVVIKTSLNHGGGPERRQRARTPLGRLRNLLSKPGVVTLGLAGTVNPQDYPIFASARQVPRRVYSNPALVVERFIPERYGDLYGLRCYTFVGDREYTEALRATYPIVRYRWVVERKRIEPPDALVAARREMGMDYGRIDYVMYEGEPAILDVNRTQGCAANVVEYARFFEALAPGLASLAASSPEADLTGG